MQDMSQTKTAAAIAASLGHAASCLAACSRPSSGVGEDSSAEEFSAALKELVSAAELFGCQASFWRWAAEAAELLGHGADAHKYRERVPRS